MKYIRFIPSHGPSGAARYGILEADGVPTNPVGGRVRALEGDILSAYTPTEVTYPLEEVTLLAPVLPSKIVAVGVNYAGHAEEMRHAAPKEPLIFLKPPTAIIGPGEVIRYPQMTRQVEYEAELAVVIGREIKSIGTAEAPKAILGYTCFNDVTARDLQKADRQWVRAKGFDTFAPIGPCIVTDLDPLDLSIESRLNGRRMQSARTSQMLFDVYTLVSFISQVMTLLPGDVIATGTPEGVGEMRPGDVIAVEIEGIGCLENRIISGEKGV